ncbi:MAG: PAS domain S-box protein [Ignavibacteriaceae bacterium]|nr:PAS domain S-box protein [Ignavibacteriaceae bacterium]
MKNNNLIPDTIHRENIESNQDNVKKVILLVEDEAIVAMTESIELKNYGYNVIHVMNGQKAIDVVNNTSNVIDLILMDINLGSKLDGTEIAKIILKDHDIPLLFLSSHTEREIVDKTEDITFYGYVVKDSGIIVLDASIKMAFRLHEAYQDLKNQKINIENQKLNLQIFEKRYRRLFEAAKDGIIILNAESGMIVDVNPFLINMLGYSKEQFLTKHIWDISTRDNTEYSKQMFKELQEKEYVRYEDLPLESSGGMEKHVEFVSNVYLVDGEKVIQCNIRDISNRIKQEQLIHEELEKQEALLKEIQHRTKNSFNMITSLIHIRSGITHSEEAKTVLEDLTLRVKSISDLYSLLYDTNSFYEARVIPYCNKVIDSVLNLSKYIEVNKNIQDITVSSSDAAIIGMILVELISNIIKYAFPDSLTGMVNIELKLKDSNVVLIVEDDGIGLPKDFDINKIESIGLHLVDLMVSQLDGKIQFVPGKGTKIIIEFPFSAPSPRS